MEIKIKNEVFLVTKLGIGSLISGEEEEKKVSLILGVASKTLETIYEKAIGEVNFRLEGVAFYNTILNEYGYSLVASGNIQELIF